MFAVKDSPYVLSGFGITNDVQPLNQVLQFRESVLNVSNTCPDTTVDLNSLVSSSTPSGSSIVWYQTSDHSGTAYSTPAMQEQVPIIHTIMILQRVAIVLLEVKL